MRRTCPDPLPDFLREIATPRSLQKGENLFMEGDAYRGPFFVRSGIFKFYTLNECGKELILHTFGAGDWMATPPTFLHGPEEYYHASSQALTCSHVDELPVRAFRNALRKNPDFMFQFASTVVKVTFAFQSRLKAISLYSVPERLEDFLRQLGADFSPVTLPLQKHEIAALLGTTPESVSRAFRMLVDCGRLSVVNHTYCLAPLTAVGQSAPA
ncbi:MAG: Crp/Fnr family transcriptional regulator [Leptospirales bacterium]|nr:Crp/Fnr family transcriptional regulator [Leptospirales bacterium]